MGGDDEKTRRHASFLDCDREPLLLAVFYAEIRVGMMISLPWFGQRAKKVIALGSYTCTICFPRNWLPAIDKEQGREWTWVKSN